MIKEPGGFIYETKCLFCTNASVQPPQLTKKNQKLWFNSVYILDTHALMHE